MCRSGHLPPTLISGHELLGEPLGVRRIGRRVLLRTPLRTTAPGDHVEHHIIAVDHHVPPGDASPLPVPKPAFPHHARTISNTRTKCVAYVQLGQAPAHPEPAAAQPPPRRTGSSAHPTPSHRYPPASGQVTSNREPA